MRSEAGIDPYAREAEAGSAGSEDSSGQNSEIRCLEFLNFEGVGCVNRRVIVG